MNASSQSRQATARLVFPDGEILSGVGFGARGAAVGEVIFNTSITGYQEIMTDPSYAGQIVCFTFPHIGNVGANDEDEEAAEAAARGLIVRFDPTAPSNWRAAETLDKWLLKRGLVGVGGLDTRKLTRRIRDKGAPHAVIAHDPKGVFDHDALLEQAKAFQGLEGLDLAKEVSTRQSYQWTSTRWAWSRGHSEAGPRAGGAPRRKVVAVDFGAKRNILRCLVDAGCDVTVLPANATADEVLAHEPEGVFLSNGPGDPAATGVYAAPMIQEVLAKDLPVFGICLGHQLLALALGAKTKKMAYGHHGANHPVKDLETGKVEITSMNHGFTVDAATLPETAMETHVSLFDGTNCGLRLKEKPVFSVQQHPEASPGPQDSFYLFERFVAAMDDRAQKMAS